MFFCIFRLLLTLAVVNTEIFLENEAGARIAVHLQLRKAMILGHNFAKPFKILRVFDVS